MRIAFIGKFRKLHDEEYIARSFEAIGHTVERISEGLVATLIVERIKQFEPDFVLFTKLLIPQPAVVLNFCKENKIKTASWNFDLYWGYSRQDRIARTAGFKADIVFTTDGGHEKEWESVGITHYCVRQGIYKDECFMVDGDRKGVVFVGSHNTLYPYRLEMIKAMKESVDLKCYGLTDTDEVRGTKLNELYGTTEIVVGDSVYSPYYWSNRVVETLGRGGFLIHQEVEGLREEYPHLVTYKKGDLEDLKKKVRYYLDHPVEREELRKKNFEWVRDNYTMDKKCEQLIKIICDIA